MSDDPYAQRGIAFWLVAFEEQIDMSAQAMASRGRGGQQVGPSGADFAHCPPSTIGRLRWWLRELRAAAAHDGIDVHKPPEGT
jgi:hypothetical protein